MMGVVHSSAIIMSPREDSPPAQRGNVAAEAVTEKDEGLPKHGTAASHVRYSAEVVGLLGVRQHDSGGILQ